MTKVPSAAQWLASCQLGDYRKAVGKKRASTRTGFESSHKNETTPRTPTSILETLKDGEVVSPFLKPVPLPLAQTGANGEPRGCARGGAHNGYNSVEGDEVSVFS